MHKFILDDEFIKNIKKNFNKLKDFYDKNINNLYFMKLPYNDIDHHLSVLLQPKKNDNWEKLKKQNNLFQEIFETDNFIIPTVSIVRMLPFPKKEFFIAHRHINNVDDKIYHVVMKCNNKCGMIIENEYLPYTQDLVFAFNAKKKHIAFNFGDDVKESFVFVSLNKKYSLDQWFDEKMTDIVNNHYKVYLMNKKYANMQIKKLANF